MNWRILILGIKKLNWNWNFHHEIQFLPFLIETGFYGGLNDQINKTSSRDQMSIRSSYILSKKLFKKSNQSN
jgi:hypothetical protein